ncbi:MAG: hypothetical protein M0P94_01820 [Candidatus Absconditabacterales bacterium]|nr:hypothetical protein [Candidatus Absconditabacterales bacterium]
MIENIQEKVQNYIESQNKKSNLSETQNSLKEFGLDLKVGEWLKNDKDMLDYAQLFLKEKIENKKRTFKEEFKIGLLELKLQIKCSYFADFKEFLKDLKESESSTKQKEDATDSKQKESKEQGMRIDNKFFNTSISKMKSHPYYKNSASGVTWCSATARFNSESFGLNLPRGDAYNAGKEPGKACLKTIPSNKFDKKPQNSWSNLSLSDFNDQKDEKINFADIYTNSQSGYGHRVVGFKDNLGQWYVLDPYTNVNGLNDKPKKLEDYMGKRQIKKVHFYYSDGYNFENKKYA